MVVSFFLIEKARIGALFLYTTVVRKRSVWPRLLPRSCFMEKQVFCFPKTTLSQKQKTYTAFLLDWKQLGCPAEVRLAQNPPLWWCSSVSRWKAVPMLPHFILLIVRFLFSLFLSFFVWWCVRPSFHPITIYLKYVCLQVFDLWSKTQKLCKL